MSFREKSAWACLVTTVAVFVPYFLHVFTLFRHGAPNPGSVMNAFIAAAIFQTILNLTAHIAFAIRSKQEKRDERDAAIELKSFQSAYGVLATSSVLAIMGVVAFGTAPRSVYTGPATALTFLSQVILLCVILAETVKYSTRAICYRRGS